MGSPRSKSTGPGLTQERVGRGFVTSTTASPLPTLPLLPKHTVSTYANHNRERVQSIQYEVQPRYFEKVRKGEILEVQPKTSRLVDYYITNEAPEYIFRTVWRGPKGSNNSYPYVRTSGIYTGVPVNLAGGTPNWNIPPAWEPRLVDAIANLRSDLWDIGTTLAEGGKSLDTLLGFVGNLRKRRDKILGIMLKRRHSQIKKQDYYTFFKEFSSMWLEARYGWRPMYYDVMDAVEAYNRIGGGLVFKRQSSTASDGKTSETDWTATAVSGLQYKWTHSESYETRAFCGGTLDYDRPVSVDPFVTAWEVVPFSFISDWVFNIGQNIQAFSPFAAGRLAYTGFSQKIIITSQLEFRVTPRPGYTLVDSDINVPSAVLMRTYTRRLPVTKPAFSFSYQPNFSWAKAVDLAAIGVSLKTGVFKTFSQRR